MADRAPTADKHSSIRPIRADDAIAIEFDSSDESNELRVCNGKQNFDLLLPSPIQATTIPGCTKEPSARLSLITSRLTPSDAVVTMDTEAIVTVTVPHASCLDNASPKICKYISTPSNGPPCSEDRLDSLDARDTVFSQEMPSLYNYKASSDCSNEMSDSTVTVTDTELRDLRPCSSVTPTSESGDLL